MLLQRYVSADLTHFVGGSVKTDRKRYLLSRKIPEAGLLKASPKKVGLNSDFHQLRKDSELPLSRNEACVGSVVCFCDIPLADLQLHMLKYGGFGLAFSKIFLAEHGASPVIYVPVKYGREFRHDFPKFDGEIIFSDTPH